MKKRETNIDVIHDYYSRIYGRYDLINKLFTFGKDRVWRKETVERCMANNPENILDLCCGTGDLTLSICNLSGNNVTVTGYDFNRKMLETAGFKARNRKFTNIRFIQGEAASMPFSDGEFDCITIGFGFRNLTFKNPNAEKHLIEMNRVLKSGGKLLILESSVPSNYLIRVFYKIYLRLFLVPLGGLISGDWKAYKYLAQSSSNFYSPSQVKSIMYHHGFILQFYKQYLSGAANLVVFQKL